MSRNVNIPKGRKGRPQLLEQYGRHLVYAEGIKTEPLYVDNINEVIQKRFEGKNSSIIIDTVPQSGGRNTLNLIEYAEDDVKNRLSKGEKIDHVWIFYDRDSFPKDSFDNSYHKIVSKNSSDYKNSDLDYCDSDYICWHACWSNECFEIWVYLHFNFLVTAVPRSEYIDKIDNCLCTINKNLKYSKNMKDLYEFLSNYGDVKRAIRFAKKIDSELQNENKKDNPSTGVYLFLEYFSKYLGINM